VEVSRIVNEADGGMLVDVTDPKAIAEAILALLNDPDKAHQLGCNGRRIVEEKYNWEHDEEELLKAMQSLEC